MCMCALVGTFFQCELGSLLHALTLYGPVGPDSLAGGAFLALPTNAVASDVTTLMTSSRLPLAPGIMPCTAPVFPAAYCPDRAPSRTLSLAVSLPGPISRRLQSQCKVLEEIYEQQ